MTASTAPTTAPAVLTLRVTQAHIDAGERQNAYLCPLALAARDAGALTVQVGAVLTVETFRSADRTADEDLVDTSYRISPRAWQFMKRFDWGLSVQPGTFRLRRISLRPQVR